MKTKGPGSLTPAMTRPARRKTEPFGIVTAAWESIGKDIAAAQRHLEQARQLASLQANLETRTAEQGEAAMVEVAQAAEALVRLARAFEILQPSGTRTEGHHRPRRLRGPG